MRFTITDETWELDHLHPAEWHFLCELPEVAAGKGIDDSAKRRLLPRPLHLPGDEDPETESEFLKDWDEFVRPDLELAFQSARQTVETDLEEVEIGDSPEIEAPEDAPEVEEEISRLTWRRLAMPLDHAEPWCSTLNQARLLLNEVHELADDDSRLLTMLGIHQEGIGEERALLLTQYEFYSVIQSILVDRILS